MNKEQIIDEAYESYLNYPLATIHDHRTNILYKNMSKGWCMLNGRSMASPHPTRHLTKEEFINKIKTDSEFSETWGLKIDERELSLEERNKWFQINLNGNNPFMKSDWKDFELDQQNIPTKLITITYKENKIESYE